MSQNSVGYIFIRNHWTYSRNNCVRVGKTSDLSIHDAICTRDELEKGWYELAFEINISKLDIVKKVLFNYFKSYNFKGTGGSQFYNIKILDEIIPYISKLNIPFKLLSASDILTILSSSTVKQINYDEYEYE